MAPNIADCVDMIKNVNASPTPAVFGMGHGMATECEPIRNMKN